MTASAGLSLAVEGGVGLLRLTRTEKRNALDAGMIERLAAICRDIDRRTDIRVVILTGADGAFCAGGDVGAWSALGPDAFGRQWLRFGHEAFDRLARLRQPVIAVLNGPALGGGLELAACADYRIAEAHATIGQPETGLGVIAGWSGTQRAVRRFGARNVRRMALFGLVLDPASALEAGIVDEVVPKGTGLDAGFALAGRLMRRGPLATELTKMLINAAEGEEVERVLDSFAGRIAAASDELQHGLSAFHAKQAPDFSGIEE